MCINATPLVRTNDTFAFDIKCISTQETLLNYISRSRMHLQGGLKLGNCFILHVALSSRRDLRIERADRLEKEKRPR